MLEELTGALSLGSASWLPIAAVWVFVTLMPLKLPLGLGPLVLGGRRRGCPY